MLLASILLASTLLLGGADPDTTARLPRSGSVEINLHSSNLVIRTNSGDQISVRGGTLDLDGKTALVGFNDRLSAKGGTVEVSLPVWARVAVNLYTGNVTVEGAPVRLEVGIFQGAIKVTGGTGSLELQTAFGAISVTDFKGTRLEAQSTSEDVVVTNATGRIELTSINGNVRLRGIRSANVEASSVSGTVEYEGPLLADGRYNFESHAGGITMTLPADVSARLHVSLFSGTFASQIPTTRLRDRDNDDEQEFTAVIGKGAADVQLDSFSGNIRILRAGSGR